MEKIQLFQGALRFSPFWMGVDFLLLFHFLFSWVSTKRKTGWSLDFWHSQLILLIVLPVLLMYPFNASIFNSISASGTHYLRLEPYVDQAFAITLFGYLFLWMGRYIYDFWKERCPFFSLYLLIQPFEKIVVKNIQSTRSSMVFFILTMLLSLLIFLITAMQGFFLRPRAFFFVHEAWRPLFNLAVTFLPLCMTFFCLRWLQFKEKLSLKLFFFLLLFSIFFGLRSITIMSLLSAGLYYLFLKEGKVKFRKCCAFATVLVFLFLYMDSLRHGTFNPLDTLITAFLSFFYGNHFSDTRDFAWTLGFWDGNLAYGKTYVAGFISFLPRFFSSYRQEWCYSSWTNSWIDTDMTGHPGLRATIFGEMFFNFGLIGVAFLGLLAGYILRLVDVKLKEIISTEKDIIKGYAKTISYTLISTLFVTIGIWGFYLFLLVHLLLVPLSKTGIVQLAKREG